MMITWSCSTCSKTFQRKGDLTRHELLHTGIRPHKCGDCGKSFSQFTALKTHQNAHTRNKPFKCGVAGCKAAFGDPSSCTRHRKEKHEPARYNICHVPGCGAKIKRRSAFKAHLRKHGLDPNAVLDEKEFPSNKRVAVVPVKTERDSVPLPAITPPYDPPSLGSSLGSFSGSSSGSSSLSLMSTPSFTNYSITPPYHSDVLFSSDSFAQFQGPPAANNALGLFMNRPDSSLGSSLSSFPCSGRSTPQLQPTYLDPLSEDMGLYVPSSFMEPDFGRDTTVDLFDQFMKGDASGLYL